MENSAEVTLQDNEGLSRPILSVTQLSNAIKHCLESTFPCVWVQGEISNFKKQTSGHLYFSVKDSDSQISAVMFRGYASALKVLPKEGDKVIVKGELNVYPPSGKYQINVLELRQVGLGELLVKLEELKTKIHKKGWFRAEHKKPIPKFPNRIGIVTSPTGAAIQDILNVLNRRFSGFNLLLNPVRVQGTEAAKEIAQAIRQFNDYNLVDVIIVGRGGGSVEDLWAFNEEIVAEAIFYSSIPIIAAVGHETDHCIAEYVADVRAPTPSAAAEIVIAEKAQQIKHLDQIEKRLNNIFSQFFRHQNQRLSGILKHPVFSSPYYLLGASMQKLDDLKTGIDAVMLNLLKNKRSVLLAKKHHAHSLQPLVQISHFKQRLAYSSRTLDQAINQRLKMCKENLKNYESEINHTWYKILSNKSKNFEIKQKRKELDLLLFNYLEKIRQSFQKTLTTLQAIDPKNLLAKGYSILFSEKSGSVVKSVIELKKDENIRIMLADGELLSTIKKVVKRHE